MDKKSSYTGISKSQLRSLNRSYISEPIKDENRIIDLISKFINGELDTIKEVLESNDTLNFKDSTGQTLVHAIIRNESPNITEEDKLKIIRMLADKNVSLNSMTQLNQNPLHLACQKGYVSIIIYLLKAGCDQKLNDNNGNAPIHYLIDKFIETCKKDDLYKPSNEEIKSVNSGQIKKINDIIKNQSLNIMIKLFEINEEGGNSYTIIQDAREIINVLNKFIQHTTKNLLPTIYKIIKNKISEINKIFLDKTDSNENKFLKAKNIILSAKEEITKLYKFNLDDNTIIWNDFIQNQQSKIISNKNNYIDKINQNIKNVVFELNNVNLTMNTIKNEYYIPFLRQTEGIYYIYLYMKNNFNIKRLSIDPNPAKLPVQDLAPTSYAYTIIKDKTNNYYIDLIDKQTQDLLEEFHIANLDIDSNGKVIPMKGSDKNYGFAKLLYESDQDASGSKYEDKIDFIKNQILNNILLNKKKITIINHSEFDENEGDLLDNLIPIKGPILLEKNDDGDNLVYRSGFVKVELGENIVPGNKKVWVYGTIIDPDLDDEKLKNISFHPKNTVLNEFVKAQEQRNKSLLNTLLTDKNKNEKDKENKYEIIDKFIKNSLFGLNFDKQKEFVFKSYEKTYSELDKIIGSQQNLTGKFFTEALFGDEHIIQAVSNTDLEFLADFAANLENFITVEFSRIVHPIFRPNIIACINADYAGFGFGLKQIVYSIASQNQLIKSIVNNANLMLKLQNKVGAPNTAIGTSYANSVAFYQGVQNFPNQNIDKFEEKITIFINFISGFNISEKDLKILVNILTNLDGGNHYGIVIPPMPPGAQPNAPLPTNIQSALNLIALVSLAGKPVNVAQPSVGNGGVGGNLGLPALNVSAAIEGVYEIQIPYVDNPLQLPGFPTGFTTLALPANYPVIPGVAGSAVFVANISEQKNQKELKKHLENFPNILPEYMQYLVTQKIFDKLTQQINITSSYNILFNNQFPPPVNVLQDINNLNDSTTVPPGFLVDSQRPEPTKKTDIIKQLSITIAQTVINFIILPGGLNKPENDPNVTMLQTEIGKFATLDSKKIVEIEKLSKDLIEVSINVIISFGADDKEKKDFSKLLGKIVLDTIANIDYMEGTTTKNDVILGTEEFVSNAIISFTDNFISIKKELLSAYLPDPNDIENVDFIPKDFNEFKIVNIGEKYFDNKKKYFVCTPINNLIKVINMNIDMMKNSFELIKEEEKFRAESIKLIIFYIKYYTNILIRCINNMVLLDKYIAEVDVDIFKKSSNQVSDILNYFESESDNQYTINILEKLKKIQQTTTISEEVFNKISNLEHRNYLSKAYNQILKIFNIFDEIIQNINKYQSEYQLGEYNKFIDEYIKTSIKPKNVKATNTMFNNYSYNIRKNFPDSYDKYKGLYITKDKGNIYKYELSTKKNFKYSLFNNDYVSKIVSDNFPYINDFNYNEFYYKVKKMEVNYNGYDYDSDEDNYYFKEYNEEFDKNNIYSNFNPNTITSINKFSRGYDILYFPNSTDKLNSVNEINTLCDIDYIKNKSNITDVSRIISINESEDRIAKYYFANELKILSIDFSTYLITNNLSELVNLIVYLIYYKIKSRPDIIDLFFGVEKTSELTSYKIGSSPNTPKYKKEIGINFDGYQLDEKYKKNILDTLAFLKTDEQEKMNYLLDIIKTFVKIILGTQINKEIGDIFEEIKIPYPNNNPNVILEKNKEKMDVFEFNDKILKMKSKYNNLDKVITNIKSSSSSSSTLEYNQVMRLMKNKIPYKDSKKIIYKCLNVRKTDELLSIESLNYRVLDINGNTIINRLIDQFNLYGIKKILTSKPFLATYKNNNNKTPIEYLYGLISNIQNVYDVKNYMQRIKKYSVSLSNSIDSNEMFTNVSLQNCENLMGEIITNSIYMFNEVMWLKLYDFPAGWEVKDKKKLKEVLEIIKEELLIVTFKLDTDMNTFITNEQKQFEEKLKLYTSSLDEEIINYKNKIVQYESDKSDLENSLMSEIDANGNIKDGYKKLINEKISIKDGYTKYINELNEQLDKIVKPNIQKVFDTYKEKKLIKSTNINWDEYEQMVNKLDSSYLKIIKILNDKMMTMNNKTISNFLINIINFDISNSVSSDKIDKIDIINKYFDKIFDSVFADYWDLDRYEDSNYNVLNKSILGILSVNVVGIISNELLNTLINYTIQKNIYSDKIKEKFEEIKTNTNADSNTILNSIRLYLNDCMITKLGKKNPDKSTYIDSDTQKKIIINELNNLVGFNFDSEDLVELGKIMDFNKFLCENISYNCYQEIIEILYDCKKMSIYYKIYKELNQVK